MKQKQEHVIQHTETVDDEDAFKDGVIRAVLRAEEVNYMIDPVCSEDSSSVTVELFTGDRFKVSIEQVWEG